MAGPRPYISKHNLPFHHLDMVLDPRLWSTVFSQAVDYAINEDEQISNHLPWSAAGYSKVESCELVLMHGYHSLGFDYW